MNSLHEEFTSILKEWSEAIVADDPDAIGQFAEPDWVLIGEGGIFPREQFLASVAHGDITHHTMSHEVHDVRIYGDIAVVITRGKNTGAFKGEEFQLDEWTTEIFVRREGGWKCSVTHLTSTSDSYIPQGGNRGRLTLPGIDQLSSSSDSTNLACHHSSSFTATKLHPRGWWNTGTTL